SDFARVVAENISVLLSTEQVDVYPWDADFNPRYQITFDIQHFEGRQDQDVVLEVFWRIIDPQNKEILRFERSVIREPLTAGDYDTLIAAKSQAVEELSKIIVNEIKRFKKNV
ncbi:MAG: PqiC family protein, partial [Desulfobacterales bacterium]|nr:PqiC family protein [Desulfobacterales bacterium]